MTDTPLDDLLVVSLEQAVAAPYCSRLLAEGGARVIKLERDGGDFARHYDTVVNGESAYFVWLNTGKESLVVDLGTDADRVLLRSILGHANVFIQNLRPGAINRLGFGYDDVRAINPNVVMCSISGYGSIGEYADRKAYDFLVQAESGLANITGLADTPARCGISVCDISTGLTAYGEILKGLIACRRTRAGRHIEISLFEVMAEWMNVPLAYYKYAGQVLSGSGVQHAQIAPYGAHATADGPIVISVQHEREWRILCESVLQRPELADDARFSDNMQRVANRDALIAEIEACFRSKTRAELGPELDAAGIAYGNLNDTENVWSHPALQVKVIESDGNEATIVRRVGDNSNLARKVPRLDEHAAAIRAEFGA
jgi:crotonobetainyl-CoA:carnitine CoA-transferase CaiB-like acyl-CoA transferase